MNAEDYVSFEVAKLLKEKGFEENVTSIYLHVYEGEDRWELRNWYQADNYNDDEYMNCISAPTLWQAEKWH